MPTARTAGTAGTARTAETAATARTAETAATARTAGLAGLATVGIATGAGRGMGKACAAALSDMVDALLLVDLDAESAAGTAKELTGRRAVAEPFVADVSDRAAHGFCHDRERHQSVYPPRSSLCSTHVTPNQKDLGNFSPDGAFARV
jgi:hypothetical protein